MRFIWTEDTGAGLHYWELVNHYLLNDSFCVESKMSNQGLLDAARNICVYSSDEYFIAFDIVYDNMDVMNKYLELSDIASSSEGKIKILDVTCFEYIIFAFKHLIDWTETGRKDKIAIRENILAAFEALRDFEGNPVPNGKGGFFDHLGEMKDSYTALNKAKKGLEGSLQNPNFSNIDKQILQDGLNQANSYLTRIEKLFKSHGGIK